MATSKQDKNSNARRFIASYNNIDYSIRSKYNLNRSMGFSELIRKAVSLSYVIRKYEDDLIDYGRLRNAIIHGNDDYIIAEPHKEVVEHIEMLEKLITAPPNALETVCRRDVLCIPANLSMREVIVKIAESTYSNLPVYNGNELIGVANGQKILDSLGRYLITGGDEKFFLDAVKIEDMLSKIENSNYYEIASADLTVDEALVKFHNNSKLLAIIVTKSGSTKERPLGIITGTDVLTLNKMLESI